MQIRAAYVPFYLEGRDDENDDAILGDDDALDVEKLAEQCCAGPDDVHTVLTRAVDALAAPLKHGKEKREWIDDHKREIKDAGGDSEEAYEHWLKGVKDEAVHSLTAEVLEEMIEDGDEDDDNDKGDDD